MKKVISMLITGATNEAEVIVDFGVVAPYNGVKIKAVELELHTVNSLYVATTGYGVVYAGISIGKFVGKFPVHTSPEVSDRVLIFEKILNMLVGTTSGTATITIVDGSGIYVPKIANAGIMVYGFLKTTLPTLSGVIQPYEVDIVIDYELAKLSQAELLTVVQLEASAV
jgi:hypothetical protein